MLVTFSFPEFDHKNFFPWKFHVDESSESSNTNDIIIGKRRNLLGEFGIIMNFNDHTVTWDIDNRYYSNEIKRYTLFNNNRGPN
jgi:hypothetical protein